MNKLLNERVLYLRSLLFEYLKSHFPLIISIICFGFIIFICFICLTTVCYLEPVTPILLDVTQHGTHDYGLIDKWVNFMNSQ